jgi:hypothetical protein
MKKLTCPRCRVPYPRWRVVVSPAAFDCFSCGAKLTLSRDTVRRVGAIGGLVLFGAAMIGGLIDGFDRIWTWQFLVAFVAISVILGQIVRAFVGTVVLRDDT